MPNDFRPDDKTEDEMKSTKSPMPNMSTSRWRLVLGLVATFSLLVTSVAVIVMSASLITTQKAPSVILEVLLLVVSILSLGFAISFLSFNQNALRSPQLSTRASRFSTVFGASVMIFWSITLGFEFFELLNSQRLKSNATIISVVQIVAIVAAIISSATLVFFPRIKDSRETLKTVNKRFTIAESVLEMGKQEEDGKTSITSQTCHDSRSSVLSKQQSSTTSLIDFASSKPLITVPTKLPEMQGFGTAAPPPTISSVLSEMSSSSLNSSSCRSPITSVLPMPVETSMSTLNATRPLGHPLQQNQICNDSSHSIETSGSSQKSSNFHSSLSSKRSLDSRSSIISRTTASSASSGTTRRPSHLRKMTRASQPELPELSETEWARTSADAPPVPKVPSTPDLKALAIKARSERKQSTQRPKHRRSRSSSPGSPPKRARSEGPLYLPYPVINRAPKHIPAKKVAKSRRRRAPQPSLSPSAKTMTTRSSTAQSSSNHLSPVSQNLLRSQTSSTIMKEAEEICRVFDKVEHTVWLRNSWSSCNGLMVSLQVDK